MARCVLSLMVLGAAPAVLAQVCPTPGADGPNVALSGIVNEYFAGASTVSAGATSITVGAARNGGAITAGDLLLVMQMQDATIDTSNGSDYGDGPGGAPGTSNGTTGIGQSGLYEYVVATSSVGSGGGTVTVFGKGAGNGLVNGYNAAPGTATRGQRTFQVVRVPQFSNVTVTGSLTASAWNGSTGGILVMDVAGDATFLADVDVQGLGFRGGGGRVLHGDTGLSVSDITTPNTKLAHATKGEGIAGTPRYISACYVGPCNPTIDTGGPGYPGGVGTGYDNARGAPGNAGGGGTDGAPDSNSQNSGGGGGSNYGAGGLGGNGWCDSGIMAGCPGSAAQTGGFGGAAYGGVLGANRLFMGGGGGAGVNSDGTGTGYDGRASSGAPGGGIILIRAGRVMGNANFLARGLSGDTSVGIDGSGGAGAGGSIVLVESQPGTGTISMDVTGGTGGSNFPLPAQGPHGPGGGGGGGLALTNIGFPSINAAGGPNGGTIDASNTLIAYGATPGIVGGVSGITGSQMPGIDAPGGCLPLLTAVQTTGTPTVAASTGATATYTITVSNTGGAARNVSIVDNALPPGWTLTGTPTYTYAPAPPGGAGSRAAGAENVASGASFPLRAGGAAPGSVPAAGASALTWGSFYIPQGGSVAINYTVAVPDAAAVGTYHNPVGLTFLDPTRTTAGRLVTPAANASANRAGAAYSANTTYETGAASPLTVGGSNYSGLEAGPNGEDVRLLPDLSIALAHTGNFIPGATNQSYSLTARNNGRAIRDLVFATDQASSVTLASVPATLGANPITVNDTLQAGITLSGVPTGTNWNCAGAAAGATSFSCTYPNASAYPIAAATSLPLLTVPVSVAQSACGSSGSNTGTVGAASGETVTANNTASDPTTVSCGQAVDVVASLNTFGTQVSATVFDVPYRVQVKNTGGVDAPNFQAIENLATAFASGTPTLTWSTPPAVAAVAPATAAQCALNPAFVASPAATTMFDGRQTLSPGDSCVVTFTVRVTYPTSTAVPTGPQNNSVVVTAYGNAPASAGGTGTLPVATDTSTNAATPPATANGDVPSPTPVTLAGIDLQLTNVATGALTVGQPGSYTVTPRNSGGAPTSGTITVTDTLPAGLQFVSAAGTGWTCTNAGQTVTCTTSAVIAGNGTGSPITINVLPLATAVPSGTSANVTNTAVVSGGGEPASATGNNTATTTNLVSLPGAASGSVWRDLNASRTRDGGEPPLAGWKVEIVDPNGGTVIRSTTTATDGTYSLTGLAPGAYRLRFRDPGNNILYGTPVNGEQGAGSAQSGSSLAADRSGLNVTIAAGQTLVQQSLPVDPSGVVYDSDARQPLPGATVQVCGPSGFAPATQLVGGGSYTVAGACASMVTSSNGFYQFLLATGAPTGSYTITVTPPGGYSTSTLTPSAGPLAPPAGPGLFAVQAQAMPPVGTQPTTYYLSLALGTGRQDVINNHIPLDPAVKAIIVADKRANTTEVEIGDLVTYTVTLRSLQGSGLSQVSFIDRLPAGFRYVPGTARVQFSGAPGVVAVPDPAGGAGPVLNFNVANGGGLVLASGGSLTLTYRVRVAVGAAQGDGINHVTASSGRITSNDATARVRVSGGVFTTDACLVGKIYLDCNDNRRQDEGEPGVPGVRFYFEDGTYLVSDGEGKYSLCGLRPTTHVLKADRTTLPLGARLGITDNRNALDPDSSFVDLKNGELHRTDFLLQNCSIGVREQVTQRREQLEKQNAPRAPAQKEVRR